MAEQGILTTRLNPFRGQWLCRYVRVRAIAESCRIARIKRATRVP
jgi:hypothetical protein